MVDTHDLGTEQVPKRRKLSSEWDGNLFLTILPVDIIQKIFRFVPNQLLMKIRDVPSVSKYVLPEVYHKIIISRLGAVSSAGEHNRILEEISQSEEIPLFDEEEQFIPKFVDINEYIGFCIRFPQFRPKELIFENAVDLIVLYQIAPGFLNGVQKISVRFINYMRQINPVDGSLLGHKISHALIASLPFNIESVYDYRIDQNALILPGSVKELSSVSIIEHFDASNFKHFPQLTSLTLRGVVFKENDFGNLPDGLRNLTLVRSLVIDTTEVILNAPQGLTSLNISHFKHVLTGSERCHDFTFDITQLSNLKSMKISGVGLTSLENLQMPKSVESLIVSDSTWLVDLNGLKTYHLKNLVIRDCHELGIDSIFSRNTLPSTLKSFLFKQSSVRVAYRDARPVLLDLGKEHYLPPNLVSLDLQHYRLQIWDEFTIPESVEFLKIIRVKRVNVKKLVRNLKRLRELECIEIPTLEGTSGICFPSTLEKLHLVKREEMNSIQTRIKSNLKSLERLTKLSILSEWSILEELPRNLEFLYLKEPNRIYRPTKEPYLDIDFKEPIRLENLRELRWNGYGKVHGVNCPKLERLSGRIASTNLKEACPNLKVWKAYSGDLELLHDFPNLHALTLSRVGTSNWDGNYNLPTSLEVLKLCGFEDEHIKQLNLTKLTKLKKLDISRNDLTKQLNLTKLTKLKKLDISRNDLTKLTSDLFPSSLTELDASWNRFSEIDLKNLESLKKLNISQPMNRRISDCRISLPNLVSLFMVDSNHNALPDITRAIDNCDHLKYVFLENVKSKDTPTLIKSKCKNKIGHVVSVGGKII